MHARKIHTHIHTHRHTHRDRCTHRHTHTHMHTEVAPLSQICLSCHVILECVPTICHRNHWRVGTWEDALFLSLWIALLYFCLEGPHAIYNARSFSGFFFHALHKLSVAFVMCWALVYFKDY